MMYQGQIARFFEEKVGFNGLRSYAAEEGRRGLPSYLSGTLLETMPAPESALPEKWMYEDGMWKARNLTLFPQLMSGRDVEDSKFLNRAQNSVASQTVKEARKREYAMLGKLFYRTDPTEIKQAIRAIHLDLFGSEAGMVISRSKQENNVAIIAGIDIEGFYFTARHPYPEAESQLVLASFDAEPKLFGRLAEALDGFTGFIGPGAVEPPPSLWLYRTYQLQDGQYLPVGLLHASQPVDSDRALAVQAIGLASGTRPQDVTVAQSDPNTIYLKTSRFYLQRLGQVSAAELAAARASKSLWGFAENDAAEATRSSSSATRQRRRP
ncbi:MAG: hypothetical protein HY519_03435 [Candidatus Aenigmarchaeota archaeon]|nr:hypothetical protein [Candidatus Aenigmarchaeota archaeon]